MLAFQVSKLGTNVIIQCLAGQCLYCSKLRVQGRRYWYRALCMLSVLNHTWLRAGPSQLAHR